MAIRSLLRSVGYRISQFPTLLEQVDEDEEIEDELIQSQQRVVSTPRSSGRPDPQTRKSPIRTVQDVIEEDLSPPRKNSLETFLSRNSDDSFLNSEINSLKELGMNFVVRPDCKLVYYWMSIVATAVVYNYSSIILRLAFSEIGTSTFWHVTFTLLDLVTDVIYMVDIAVQMNIGYYQNGSVILDREKTKQNYFKSGYHYIDVASGLPLSLLLKVPIVTTQLVSPELYYILSSDGFGSLLRLPRLLKYHTVFRFFYVIDSKTSHPNSLRAAKLTLYMWMVIHWEACLYYMMSESQGLGSDEWTYPSSDGLQSFSSKYIRCFYWSTVTLTTIGGTANPVTDMEYLFTGTTFLIGLFLFAAVVGNVGEVISNMNASRQDFQRRLDSIKFFMNHRKVPHFLQDKVKKWADFAWNRTKAIDDLSVLQMLPNKLAAEIAIYVNMDMLKRVDLFKECEEGLLRELVLKLKPQIFCPGDYICRYNEIGKEMYFINTGVVEVLIPSQSGKMEVVTTLSTGAYFGEVSLLKLGPELNRRNADVRSVGYSELLCLSRRELNLAIVEYPDTRKVLEEIATKRQNAAAAKNVDGERSKSDEPIKKSTKLASVIASDSFKTMVNKRRTEVIEMRDLINQMKELNNKVTADLSTRQIEQAKEIKYLRKRLSKRDRRVREMRRNSLSLLSQINGNSRGIEFSRLHPHSLDSESDRSFSSDIQNPDVEKSAMSVDYNENDKGEISSPCRTSSRSNSFNSGTLGQNASTDTDMNSSHSPSVQNGVHNLGVPRASLRKSNSFGSSGSFDLEEALASMSHVAIDDAFDVVSTDDDSEDESDSDLDASLT